MPRVQSYTPEMGEAKPKTQLETDYAYGGGHWIYSPVELPTNRSIQFNKTYTERDLGAGDPRIGWRIYRVTDRGLKLLEEQYTISRKVLLD